MGGGYSASTLYKKLEDYFQPAGCSDIFKIGLQYHNTDNIEKAYTATFAGDEVFDFLHENNVKNALLFTHHPAPQRNDLNGPPPEIKNEYIEFMENNAISLFSYHIPLDRNGRYSPGNNLAAAMGAKPYDEFYFQNNVLMGVLCHTDFTYVGQVLAALEKAIGHSGMLYPYGEKSLNKGRIAIMAGGASNTKIYQELCDKNINTFVTGVTNSQVDWVSKIHEQARLNGVNLIGGTHYSTEKFAPQAMVAFFQDLGIASEFIPEKPNMSEL